MAILVDASALIALLDRDDSHHEACVNALMGIRDHLVTVWPAFTEAMHLLADARSAPAALCDMVGDGLVNVLQTEAADLVRVKTLMSKYEDLPMDFADATLVVAAERHGLSRILTFDRQFTVYRLPRRGRFTVLPAR